MIEFTLDELRTILDWAAAKADSATKTKNWRESDKYAKASAIWKKAHAEYSNRINQAGA